MPIYFSVPLPGPFRYSKRVGGRSHRARRSTKVAFANKTAGQQKVTLVAVGIIGWVILTAALPPVGLIVLLAGVVLGVVALVRRHRAKKAMKANQGKTFNQMFEESQRNA